MPNIAIFASGSGTNAQRITEYFKNHSEINISLILTNNKDAFVIERAKKLDIPHVVFSKFDLEQNSLILKYLEQYKIDWIVLAGFLLKIPDYLINEFPQRIINIHPALLPKYGGKGMYGSYVHKAVINNNEVESGITIHFVNAYYDEGKIIFQAKVSVMPNETPETLAQKIHLLEYEHFAIVIENVITSVF